jgi:hypothetical protein
METTLMGALFALIPGKDLVYGALIVALLAFGIYERHHLIAEGEQHELAALKLSSGRLQAAAQKQVAATAADYANTLSTVKENLDAQIKTASAQHDSDARRLRDFDAYRSQHPALASAPAGQGPVGQGSSSPSSNEHELASLEQVASGLADAGREVSIALTACVNERAALTGK